MVAGAYGRVGISNMHDDNTYHGRKQEGERLGRQSNTQGVVAIFEAPATPRDRTIIAMDGTADNPFVFAG